MKRLLLLRHAKSSWEDPRLADHDRPLAPRGLKAGKLIATYIRDKELRPAMVLCSSAVRARRTLDLLAPAMPEESVVEIESDVYNADSKGLLALLRSVPRDVPSVLLIGHNPAMQDLVLTLATEGSQLQPIREKFPTAALAVLDVDIDDWADLKPGTAALDDFVTPKQLLHKPR